MIKLKEPYVYYDDTNDVLYIYDGKTEVAQIEQPQFDLKYVAESLGCEIENSAVVSQNRELVKIEPSGICRLSKPVAEIDGRHVLWYRFAGEEYKVVEAFTDENGEFVMFDVGNVDSNIVETVYFVNVKAECYLRDCLIDEGDNDD